MSWNGRLATRDSRDGAERTSRELFAAERAQLRPLPAQAYAACETVTTRIDKFSTVRFDNCSYSVPVEHAHQPCVVRGYLDRLEILREHECVATHARGQVAEQYVLEPRHYLPLLRRKPGLLHNGRPFQGEPFGADFALLRRELEYRYAADGTKQFLRVMLLLTEHPEADVFAAVSKCVALRAFNADAIENALRNTPLNLPASRLDLSDRPELASVGNGIRLASEYDVLFESQRDTNSDSDPSASRWASAPGPATLVDESVVDESVVDESVVDESVVDESVVDESVVDHRGADAAPLAKTFASSPDALTLCCLEVDPDPDPVPITRKEEAA